MAESEKPTNIVLANVEHGQIVTRSICATRVPDEMIRDGWVEVYRDAPPTIHVVVEGGTVRTILSSLPAARLKITDLDREDDPEQARERIGMRSKGLYSIPVE